MVLTVFGPREYHKYISQNCNSVMLGDNARVVCVDNGLVCVYQKIHVMGVYDRNNRFVSESSLMLKNDKKHRSSRTPPIGKSVPYVDTDVLYLGNVHWHFGHFLLEHTNRMWAIKEFLGRGVKFLFIHSTVAK